MGTEHLERGETLAPVVDADEALLGQKLAEADRQPAQTARFLSTGHRTARSLADRGTDVDSCSSDLITSPIASSWQQQGPFQPGASRRNKGKDATSTRVHAVRSSEVIAPQFLAKAVTPASATTTGQNADAARDFEVRTPACGSTTRETPWQGPLRTWRANTLAVGKAEVCQARAALGELADAVVGEALAPWMSTRPVSAEQTQRAQKELGVGTSLDPTS
eukprot:2560089-Rhodomonas_salina.2